MQLIPNYHGITILIQCLKLHSWRRGTFVETSEAIRQYTTENICYASRRWVGLDNSEKYGRLHVERVARTLSQVYPSRFGLLTCYGVVKRKDHQTAKISSIHRVFKLPMADGEPSKSQIPPIETTAVQFDGCLGLGTQLARAVSFIHTCGLVHKNMRPESTLILSEDEEESLVTLGLCYLAGFNFFFPARRHVVRVSRSERLGTEHLLSSFEARSSASGEILYAARHL